MAQRKVLEWALQKKCKRDRPRKNWKNSTKKQRKQRIKLKKTVTEGKSGDWGRRNGDRQNVMRVYIFGFAEAINSRRVYAFAGMLRYACLDLVVHLTLPLSLVWSTVMAR
jgi:hypothetical protein